MAFAIQADLENAVGGANRLRELSDKGNVGQIDVAKVQDWLEDGAAKVRSAAEVKHDPEVLANLDTPSLKLLVDANAAISARTAFIKGGEGMAMPDWVADAAKRADEFCDLLGLGRRRLGRVKGGGQAAINQPAKVVDHDPFGCKVSVEGFKKGGFR